ncbi:MAG: hypothetical protein U1F20_06285 [Lysobacterales bacterium]
METGIVDPEAGAIVSSAPIAWEGMVFVSAALGDYKGVRGRIYALAADSGKILWETCTVPKMPGD